MKLKLIHKFLLLILLPALLGMFVLETLANYSAKLIVQDEIAKSMENIVTIQGRELENIIITQEAAILTLAENSSINAYLVGINEDYHPEELKNLADNAKTSLITTASKFSRMAVTGILNTSGETLMTSGNFTEIPFAELTQFKACISQRKSTIETVVNSTGVAVYIFAPVINNKNVIGIIFGSLDMTSLASSTIDNTKIGNTSSCFVLTNTYQNVMHSVRANTGGNMSNVPWAVDMINAKGTGFMNFVWNNTNRFGAYSKVPSLNWTVGIAVDQAEGFAPVKSLSNTLLTLVIIIGAIVGVIILIMSRSISSVIGKCAAFAQHIAQGALTISEEQKAFLTNTSKRKDELGTLSAAIHTMVEKLIHTVKEANTKTEEAEKATILASKATEEADEARKNAEKAKKEGMYSAAEQLEVIAGVISSASEELTAQIHQSETGAFEQAHRLTETATAMEEMNSTVIEVARNASNTASISANTKKNAEEGAHIVQNVIHSIEQVQKQSLELKQNMGVLNQQAIAISQVMNVISDIADQTNLLALNAAIEAARAGDAGRGFAVVADEVRNLAEKTMVSTSEVGNTIRNIQESAKKNTMQVESAVNTILEATDLANASGKALAEIVIQADKTADQIRAIATASEEQSATSDEINHTIAQVNAISTNNATSMKEATQAVTELSRQAQILADLISQMKNQ